MLLVKLLTSTAKAPVLAHRGEDIAYDLFSDVDVVIPPGEVRAVGTGVAIQFRQPRAGAILKCRSGYAVKLQMSIEGGVIDAGYRGEVIALVRNHSKEAFLKIVRGEKIVQMLKHPVPMDKVKVVNELTVSKRGTKGFGSTGTK